MSNCLSFSFPPPPAEPRVSFSGKLLAVDPGVNEGGMFDAESMVWVIGISRGAGDGFVDGAEVDDVDGGGSREDEDRLFGEGERVEEAIAGELDGRRLGPTGVVLRSWMSTDAAALRTASYSDRKSVV